MKTNFTIEIDTTCYAEVTRISGTVNEPIDKILELMIEYYVMSERNCAGGGTITFTNKKGHSFQMSINPDDSLRASAPL